MLLLRLSNLLQGLGAFLGHDDRSQMHLRAATYFQMKCHLMRFSVAEGAHTLSYWEVVGELNVLKVEATPKPPISSRRKKKCCSPRLFVSAWVKLVKSLYIGERNVHVLSRRNLIQCV